MITALPRLSLSEAFNLSTRRLLDCESRSRRSEFWWARFLAFLVCCLIPPASLVLELMLIPLTVRRLHDTGRSGWWVVVGVFVNILFLVILIYNFASLLFHAPDTIAAHSSVWSLLPSMLIQVLLSALIVLGYNILMLVFLTQDSQPGPNQYGESPKYVMPAE